MELEPSAEYKSALERSREASRAFTKAQSDYRSLKIGDAEYLAARSVYDKSVAEFDAAFAAEQARMGNVPEITADDLRHERTWLLQHGMHELTTVGGMSFIAAARKLEKDVEELSRKIDKLEGK